ncbi:ferritin-like domain-containing protein [Chryseobacterium sp. POL2]|uniref:YciE/YciF ferroxidase family protein n=1 Tax=Chryseobacterium sp. POL2 TaxID=2713414 RepID=UPI0013E1ED17|nr:ferritin-like domain-containing protein [Chryseobacterium sp. POL2]QIG89385.1 ferritin-like domain-containing protein [Chryseobacterium sp. POL2]
MGKNRLLKSTSKIAAKKDAATTLDDLFESCLKDALLAENALYKTLPKMSKNATSTHLKKALDDHRKETAEHIKILKAVFKSIGGVKDEEEKCDAMAGIIEEGKGVLEETQLGAVRDAGIIAACQKAEHYEIASYGTMISYAGLLKHTEAKKLLNSILKQEKNADKLLSKLATSEINIKAK